MKATKTVPQTFTIVTITTAQKQASITCSQ